MDGQKEAGMRGQCSCQQSGDAAELQFHPTKEAALIESQERIPDFEESTITLPPESIVRFAGAACCSDKCLNYKARQNRNLRKQKR